MENLILKKKLQAIFIAIVAMVVLVACGQRDDLTVADFPSVSSGLTKSELEQAVGKPHESSKDDLEVLDMMALLLNSSVSIEVDPSWNAIEDTPTQYYVYQLADGESAMVFILVGDQVVEMTRQPISY